MIDKKKGVMYISGDQIMTIIHANSRSGTWSAIRAICAGFSVGSVIPAILNENPWWLIAIAPLLLLARHAGRQNREWRKVVEHVTEEIREGVIS